MKNYNGLIFLIIFSTCNLFYGCIVEGGRFNYLNARNYCDNEFDFCVNGNSFYYYSEWEYVENILDCNAEYDSCISNTITIYPTCRDIFIACSEYFGYDAYNDCRIKYKDCSYL